MSVIDDTAQSTESSPPGFFRKFGRTILVLTFLAAPLGIWSAHCVLDTVDNDVSDWLPPSSPAVFDFREFQDAFGGEDVIAISWPGCTLDDPRLTKFAETLDQAHVADGGSARRLFLQVVSGHEMVERLTGPPLNIDPDRALERLRGITLGDDLKTTCAIAIPARGSLDSEAILDEIQRVALSVSGLEPADVAVVGTPLFISQMNDETNRLIRLAAAAAIVGLLIAWWHLRQLKLIVSLFLSSLMITGVGMVALYVAGTKMNALLILLPALWFILSVSAGVHLINYYLDAIAEKHRRPVEVAVSRGLAPTALATMTTVIGLGTLTVSHLGPVRQFGFFGALGLAQGLIVLFLLLPSLLEHWPEQWNLWNDSPRGQRLTSEPGASEFAPNGGRMWDWLTGYLDRHHRNVVIFFGAFMVFLGAGVLRTRVAADQLDYFRTDSALVKDFDWFEQQIGPLIPIELTVRFAEETRPTQLIDRIQAIGELSSRLSDTDSTITTFSAASIVPKIADRADLAGLSLAEKATAGARRKIQAKHIETHRQELVNAGYLYGEGETELWRITVRTSSTSDAQYQRFVDSVRSDVAGILHGEDQTAPKMAVTFTGTPILSMRIRQDLWDVLTKSFLLSFIVISIVMAVALRSLVGGILAMGPNVFPLLLSFGVMGWLAVALDIGAVMTVSVALGIAVDDTFHYLIWFRRGRKDGLSQAEAVRWAYRHCGAAMVQTSLICGVSLLLFAFSGFVPASRFGILMSLMLGAALLGDLILLPALLIGPAGRRFGVSSTESEFEEEPLPVPATE